MQLILQNLLLKLKVEKIKQSRKYIIKMHSINFTKFTALGEKKKKKTTARIKISINN